MSRQHNQIDSEVKKTNAEGIWQAGAFRFSYWIPVVKESHSISPHRFMTVPVAVAMHLRCLKSTSHSSLRLTRINDRPDVVGHLLRQGASIVLLEMSPIVEISDRLSVTGSGPMVREPNIGRFRKTRLFVLTLAAGNPLTSGLPSARI